MPGPSKKATSLKLIQGTAQPCRLNLKEPTSILFTVYPKPPRKLPKEAKREWKRVIPYIVRNGLCGPESLSVLATYCQAHAMIVATEQRGEVYRADLLTAYRQLVALFGLDPSSRTKIHAQVVADRGNTWSDVAKQAIS